MSNNNLNEEKAKEMYRNLSEKDKEKINKILSDKEQLEKILKNPLAAELMKKFSGGGKNG